MRKVMYEAIKADGTVFNTSSYCEATAEDTRILKTYLVDIDLESEKSKEWGRKRIAKIWKDRK